MNDYRIIDASINRASEGLRVLEDSARFGPGDRPLAQALREIRHEVRKAGAGLEKELLAARDAAADVGQAISRDTGLDVREGCADLASANFKRVQEALRSLEEGLKAVGRHGDGKAMEALRFKVYDLETVACLPKPRRLPAGIYGITAETFSRGRSNVETARQMVEAGVSVLQYREKTTRKTFNQMLSECREIRKVTADHGVVFIVNDFAGLAVAADADGVHSGQDDLPVEALRTIVGDRIVGISTHSPDQARQAVTDGADYIGVGPLFSTRTKENVCDAVGLEYLEWVAGNVSIPFVAIGGIKQGNLSQVTERGAETVCLVTEIVGAEDIRNRVGALKRIMEESSR